MPRIWDFVSTSLEPRNQQSKDGHIDLLAERRIVAVMLTPGETAPALLQFSDPETAAELDPFGSDIGLENP